MDALRGRGSSGVWHHGGLVYRRTVDAICRPWGSVQHSTYSIRRGLQVYGRVGEKIGKLRAKNGKGRERQTRRTRLRLRTNFGDRRKLEKFQSRVDWTHYPRSPEAASAAPIGKPENYRLRERVRCGRCYVMPLGTTRGVNVNINSCDPEGGGIR